MVILNALFSWLVQAGNLAGNPLALSRQRSRKIAPRITRYLEPGLWQAVKDTIASMPQDSPRPSPLSPRAVALHAALSGRAAYRRGRGQHNGAVFRATRS